MRRDRHRSVRPALDRAFGAAIVRAADFAQQQAKALLVGAGAAGPHRHRRRLCRPAVHARVHGHDGDPRDHWEGLDAWVRAALNGHDEGAAPAMRMQGGTASLAMRGYFNALGMNGFEKTTAAGAVPLMGGIAALTNTRCPRRAQGPSETETAPIRDDELSVTEATQTAVHFALGGYLSTEFLITTGVSTCCATPTSWTSAREPALMDARCRGDAALRRAVPDGRPLCRPRTAATTVAGNERCTCRWATDSPSSTARPTATRAVRGRTPDGFDIMRELRANTSASAARHPPLHRRGTGTHGHEGRPATLLDGCPRLGKGTAFSRAMARRSLLQVCQEPAGRVGVDCLDARLIAAGPKRGRRRKASGEILRFGRAELDAAAHELRIDGKRVPARARAPSAC